MTAPRPLQEAHAHLFMLGRSLSLLQLGGCGCVEECLDLVRATASSLSKDAWVLGMGVRVEGWKNPRWPTREELGAASDGRPCVLMSFDHHCVVADRRAMEIAGLRDDSPNPEGGVIVRDRAGRPTGVLLESAAKTVWNAAPEPDASSRPMIIRRALDHMKGLGFTHVHDLLAPPWLGEVLTSVLRPDDPRVGIYVHLDVFDQVARGAKQWERPGLRMLGAKVFADGTLNSRTAWMLEPFADGHEAFPCGQSLLSRADLSGAIMKARNCGLGLAVHAIGDGAVRATLDAWESLDGVSAPRGAHGAPALRIEHCEVIDEADVPRFAKLGVVCSVQPCHLLSDVEVLRRALPHRLDRVLPLRELVDSGCRSGELLWFGSDVPIVRADPVDSIQAAVHRRRTHSAPRDAIAPEQALSEEDAWAGFNPTLAL